MSESSSVAATATPPTKLEVTIWSLFFGILAIGDAVSQWMVTRKEHNKTADDVNPKG